MKKVLFLIFIAITVSSSSCSQKKSKGKEKIIDTIPMMVMQIKKCSKLYTAEVHVHKIITHNDDLKLKGSILKKSFDINIPGTNRKVAIPMDATLKAYVDFKDFSSKNVNRNGEKIEIILPDPKVMLTSSKIGHEEIKQYVSLTRKNFSDAELATYEQQGRVSIIKDIANMDIIETARQSAANTLIPLLRNLGFQEYNIKISFRKRFTFDDLKSILDRNTIKERTINGDWQV